MALPRVAAGPVSSPGVAAPEQGRAALREHEKGENFPVALRVLPRDLRMDLRAIYDVVRTIDDLGDEHPDQPPEARVAALHFFAAELAKVWMTGAPRTPVLTRLVPAVRRRGLPPDPFDRLVRANLLDQEVSLYSSFDDLLAYCQLSAAPIGELVLTLFEVATPARVALSDRVCAGLQVVEHLQDVAEDRRAGRVYLPQDDLAAFGVPESDLDTPTATPALRRLVLAETDRAADLLSAGPPLVASLRGWARLAVAGYVAGGRAAVEAVRRTDGDVLAIPAPVRRRDVVRHLVTLLLDRRTSC